MKYTLFLLCLLPFFICDGVRVAINEKFIDAVLQNFLPEIKKLADGVDLPDSGILDRLHFSIPNFSLDKVKLSFTDAGLLNLQINGLSPELKGRATKRIIVKIRKSFTVTLKNFKFNGNLRITSKKENGVLIPDVYFNSDPSINFSVKLDLGHGLLNKLVAALLSGVANLAKRFVMPAIKKQLKRLLEDVVSKLPKQISIPINGINYKLDVTLSESGIQLRNKFLEINSNARLYNENKSLTKTKYFPQVTFPSIKTMGSQLQLYISEYSVSAAIYTLLVSNNQEIKVKVKSKELAMLIPDNKFGNEVYIVFTGTPDISLQITEPSLNINVPGTLSLRTLDNQSILTLDLKLALKVKASIENGAKVTAAVNDLEFNINSLNLNKLSLDLSGIKNGINAVKPFLIPLLNDFIDKKMKITFPTVMGIKFTQLSLTHYNHYIQINYNLVRN